MKSKQWKLVTVFADFISYPVPWLTGKVVMLNNYICIMPVFIVLEFYIF